MQGFAMELKKMGVSQLWLFGESSEWEWLGSEVIRALKRMSAAAFLDNCKDYN